MKLILRKIAKIPLPSLEMQNRIHALQKGLTVSLTRISDKKSLVEIFVDKEHESEAIMKISEIEMILKEAEK